MPKPRHKRGHVRDKSYVDEGKALSDEDVSSAGSDSDAEDNDRQTVGTTTPIHMEPDSDIEGDEEDSPDDVDEQLNLHDAVIPLGAVYADGDGDVRYGVDVDYDSDVERNVRLPHAETERKYYTFAKKRLDIWDDKCNVGRPASLSPTPNTNGMDDSDEEGEEEDEDGIDQDVDTGNNSFYVNPDTGRTNAVWMYNMYSKPTESREKLNRATNRWAYKPIPMSTERNAYDNSYVGRCGMQKLCLLDVLDFMIRSPSSKYTKCGAMHHRNEVKPRVLVELYVPFVAGETWAQMFKRNFVGYTPARATKEFPLFRIKNPPKDAVYSTTSIKQKNKMGESDPKVDDVYDYSNEMDVGEEEEEEDADDSPTYSTQTGLMSVSRHGKEHMPEALYALFMYLQWFSIHVIPSREEATGSKPFLTVWSEFTPNRYRVWKIHGNDESVSCVSSNDLNRVLVELEKLKFQAVVYIESPYHDVMRRRRGGPTDEDASLTPKTFHYAAESVDLYDADQVDVRYKALYPGFRAVPHSVLKLAEYQVNALNMAIHKHRGRSLVNLGPGLGKTLIGCMFANYYAGQDRTKHTVVVVCPNSKKDDWIRDYVKENVLGKLKWKDFRTSVHELIGSKEPSKSNTHMKKAYLKIHGVPFVHTSSSMKKKPKMDKDAEYNVSDVLLMCRAILEDSESHDVHSFTYEKMGQLLSDMVKKTDIGGEDLKHAEVIRRAGVFLIDECHRLKSAESRNAFMIADFLNAHREIKVLLMSGTPEPNRPSELYNLLYIIRPDVFNKKRVFMRRYCDMQYDMENDHYNGCKLDAEKARYDEWASTKYTPRYTTTERNAMWKRAFVKVNKARSQGIAVDFAIPTLTRRVRKSLLIVPAAPPTKADVVNMVKTLMRGSWLGVGAMWTTTHKITMAGLKEHIIDDHYYWMTNTDVHDELDENNTLTYMHALVNIHPIDVSAYKGVVIDVSKCYAPSEKGYMQFRLDLVNESVVVTIPQPNEKMPRPITKQPMKRGIWTYAGSANEYELKLVMDAVSFSDDSAVPKFGGIVQGKLRRRRILVESDTSNARFLYFLRAAYRFPRCNRAVVELNMRYSAGLIKSRAMFDNAYVKTNILDKARPDHKIVFFVHFNRTRELLEEGLLRLCGQNSTQVVSLSGKDSIAKRSNVVSKIQDVKSPVLFAVLSIKAMSEGIDLTKGGKTVVMVDLDYVPSAMIQAEKRVHRGDTEFDVDVYWLFLHRSFDANIHCTQMNKQRIIGRNTGNKQMITFDNKAELEFEMSRRRAFEKYTKLSKQGTFSDLDYGPFRNTIVKRDESKTKTTKKSDATYILKLYYELYVSLCKHMLKDRFEALGVFPAKGELMTRFVDPSLGLASATAGIVSRWARMNLAVVNDA